MRLETIADMFADILNIDDVYAGNIDSNLDKCIGVYNAKNQGAYKIALGGKPCTKTFEKKISILIHWTDNPTLVEQKANEILDVISSVRDYDTTKKQYLIAKDGKNVVTAFGKKISLESEQDFILNFFQCNAPVPIGRDERGICEYVIEAKIYYAKL